MTLYLPNYRLTLGLLRFLGLKIMYGGRRGRKVGSGKPDEEFWATEYSHPLVHSTTSHYFFHSFLWCLGLMKKGK
jgi:hypothetical protein